MPHARLHNDISLGRMPRAALRRGIGVLRRPPCILEGFSTPSNVSPLSTSRSSAVFANTKTRSKTQPRTGKNANAKKRKRKKTRVTGTLSQRLPRP
eukprot:4357840-Alexandrium_andersonii.AAC.1